MDKNKQQTINPGLYLVSTPIGNMADLTFRAVDVLKKSEMGITNFSDMILMGLRVEYPDFDESLIWSPTK